MHQPLAAMTRRGEVTEHEQSQELIRCITQNEWETNAELQKKHLWVYAMGNFRIGNRNSRGYMRVRIG